MHSVKVTCNGGISALSAFFNGKGCSVALDLPMELVMSEVEAPFTRNERAVEKTLDILRERFGVKQSYNVIVQKGIPRGKGLKSSSVMTLSVALAFLRLNGQTMRDEELLGMCADLSIRNKTSLTGAYDDLCSSYYGGVCLTDNGKRELIMRDRITDDEVLLAYPRSGRRSASVNSQEMKKYSKHAERIFELVKNGLYYEAMSLNGTILGNILGQYPEITRYFLSTGAIYSSQCGKGPAIFGIYDTIEGSDAAYSGLSEFRGIGSKQTLFTNKAVTIS